MGLSRDLSWPPLFSASCFLRCCLMRLVARIMESTFDIALTPLSSTSEGFTQRPKWRLILSSSFCSPTTVHRTKAHMQNSVDKFSVAWGNFGLTISTKKSEVMRQPVPEKPCVEPNITIKGQRLKVVEKYTYLGSTLSKPVVMDDEVNTRLQKQVQPLADSTGMCGIGEASRRQPKSRYTELSFLPPSFMVVKRGLLINSI